MLRSTVLHISPDALRWAQWMLADEPFHLGGLPIAWQICAREHPDTSIARWSAYFTPEVPGEAIVDFLLALDACPNPATGWGAPELVLDAATAHGWLLDGDEPENGAVAPTFTSHLAYGDVPPLIQDTDPHTLVAGAGGETTAGWQAWAQPGPDAPYLWAASFSSGVPHGLVAAFAASLSSTAPVLRRVLPESARDQLLRVPADKT